MDVEMAGTVRNDPRGPDAEADPDGDAPAPPVAERRRVVLVVEDTPEDVEVISRYLSRLSDTRYVVRAVPRGEDGLAALRAATTRGRRGQSPRRFGGRGRPTVDQPRDQPRDRAPEPPTSGAAEPDDAIDCVLLDFHLPDMTALEFLDGLAAADGSGRAPDDGAPAPAPARERGVAGEPVAPRRLPVPVVILSGTANRLEPAVAALKRGALDFVSKQSITPVALHRAIEAAVERFEAARLLEEQREALARQNRALDAAAARTARLLGATTALAVAAGPTEVAAALIEGAVEALAADSGALVLRGEDGELQVVDPSPGAAPRQPGRDAAGLPVGQLSELAPGVAAVARQATVSGEAVWETTGRAGAAGAAVAVPLVVYGRRAGALTLAFSAPRPLSPEERAFLLTLARLGAQALDRARLFVETQAARAEAEVARRRAEEANQAKSQFLATMSHELRTPLNAIRGYVDLIEAGVYGDVTPEQYDALERVRRSEAHLLGLINEILDFARLEARPPQYRREPVLLQAVVDDARAFVEPQLRAKALTFDATCDTRTAALADPDRVRQIVLNLLSNALKFTPAGGLVTLRCAARDDCAVLEVADTGIGIPADKLDTIFEPFVQLGRTLNAPASGTGLGLAISRQLARGMGGELSARSDAGRGAVFTLVLPGAEGAS